MYTSANVTLMVKDFPAALAFYTDTLGLTLKMRAGDEWAELEAPGLNLALHPTRGQAVSPGSAATLGLQVADINAAYEQLKGRGVTFTSSVLDTGHLLLANLTDPEGNPIYLMQHVGGEGGGAPQ